MNENVLTEMNGSEIIRKKCRQILGVTPAALTFLLSKSLLENFDCGILCDSCDDIRLIFIRGKDDANLVFHLCMCYLQLRSSSKCNIAQKYHEVLLSQIYLYSISICHRMCICGDFNGHIGNQQDFEDKLDSIPQKRN